MLLEHTGYKGLLTLWCRTEALNSFPISGMNFENPRHQAETLYGRSPPKMGRQKSWISTWHYGSVLMWITSKMTGLNGSAVHQTMYRLSWSNVDMSLECPLIGKDSPLTCHMERIEPRGCYRFRKRMEEIWRFARNSMAKAQEQQKKQARQAPMNSRFRCRGGLGHDKRLYF